MNPPRLRILFLTPQLPYPPRQGTSIRNYNLIRYLGQTHSIDLVSFLAPDDDLTPDSPLNDICDNIHTLSQPDRLTRDRLISTLTSPQPDMGLRLYSPAMFNLLDELPLEEYDIVQVEGIEMAPYGLHLAEATKLRSNRPAIVFDNHNCEYLLQKRNALTDAQIPSRWIAAAYSMAQWQKLRTYERRICEMADLVLAVSEPDKQALEQLASSSEIVLVPNGIDTNAYGVQNIAACHDSNIVFTGKMDYRPNIDAALWFGTQVFPLVQSEKPSVVFQIVGQQPHPRLDALRSNPGIEITGAVPEIQPYLSEASVFVIPMRVGGGTRLKALEAMAAGLPIVTTSLGIEGISVQDDRELLIRDNPKTFAAAVIHLINDRQTDSNDCQRLGRAAREFVVENYDWTTIVPILEQAYYELMQKSTQNPT